MSYKTPTEHTITNGIYLDAKIAEIQSALSGLSWLSYSFGRAFRHSKDGQSFYPAVYQGGTADYLNCFPNDHINSFSFVYVRQPQTINAVDNGVYHYEAELGIVFYFQLDKLSTTHDYRFTELLKYDVMTKLDDIEGLTVTAVIDEIEEAYSDFSSVDAQFLDDDNGGMRFDCTVKYSQNCEQSNTY